VISGCWCLAPVAAPPPDGGASAGHATRAETAPGVRGALDTSRGPRIVRCQRQAQRGPCSRALPARGRRRTRQPGATRARCAGAGGEGSSPRGLRVRDRDAPRRSATPGARPARVWDRAGSSPGCPVRRQAYRRPSRRRARLCLAPRPPVACPGHRRHATRDELTEFRLGADGVGSPSWPGGSARRADLAGRRRPRPKRPPAEGPGCWWGLRGPRVGRERPWRPGPDDRRRPTPGPGGTRWLAELSSRRTRRSIWPMPGTVGHRSRGVASCGVAALTRGRATSRSRSAS
jgi:hypothetical protein